MTVEVSPEARRRLHLTLLVYRTYMTKREAAKRSAQVKAALHSLVKDEGKGAFEELLERPVDGIR